MTDEAKPAGTIEAPMAVWVQGGTTSLRSDMQQAQQRAEADARRDAELARHQTALKNPFEARVSTTSFASQQSNAWVVLGFRSVKDRLIHNWMMCELFTELKAETDELILQMMCPYCVGRGIPAGGDAQFRVRQSNRGFSLDTRGLDQRKPVALKDTRGIAVPVAKELWANPEDPDQTVVVAGTITTHGPLKCGGRNHCGWTFDIDDSVIITRRSG